VNKGERRKVRRSKDQPGARKSPESSAFSGLFPILKPVRRSQSGALTSVELGRVSGTRRWVRRSASG
jgi:hypothetical protein